MERAVKISIALLIIALAGVLIGLTCFLLLGDKRFTAIAGASTAIGLLVWFSERGWLGRSKKEEDE